MIQRDVGCRSLDPRDPRLARLDQFCEVLLRHSATFALPLEIETADAIRSATGAGSGNLPLFFGYLVWSLVYNSVLLLAMMRLFQVRWRVAE